MKISEIRSLSNPLMHILPIQSIRQALSYTVFTFVGVLLFELILELFSQPKATPIILIGAFSGSSVILSQTLPAVFRVDLEGGIDTETFSMEIARQINTYGYRAASQLNQKMLRFSPKMPHWLSWTENQLTIKKHSDSIDITGPIFIIRILHGRIRKEFANAEQV